MSTFIGRQYSYPHLIDIVGLITTFSIIHTRTDHDAFCPTADDIELVFMALEFPGSVNVGDTQCVDLMAFIDDIPEPTEILYILIFEISNPPVQIFMIDSSRTFAELSIVDGKTFAEILECTVRRDSAYI